jgi:hypothetical protein
MVPIVLLTMGEGILIVENITVLINNRTRSYRESQNFYWNKTCLKYNES